MTARDILNAEELRYDTLPPRLWCRPKTLMDLNLGIAVVQTRMADYRRRISEGKDVTYYEDCLWRAEQQLAIYRDAAAKLRADKKEAA